MYTYNRVHYKEQKVSNKNRREVSKLINSLTSFRFIAALMVFIFHVGLFSKYQLGAAGVSFFFVLSGFILTFNYHEKMQDLNKEKIKKFYIARFAKIYPLHILTFLMALPITLIFFDPDGLYLIKLAFMSVINLSLVQSFIPSQSTYFNFNGVSWTLSVELFFYLTFPFLLWLFMKMKVYRKIGISVFVLFVVWVILFTINLNVNENNSVLVWLLHIFPVSRLFEFATGMILGLIFISKYEKNSVKKTVYSKLELISVVFFLVSIVYSSKLSVSAVRGGFFIPVWCILIYVFAHQSGIISKMLSNKLLVHFGEISFSFYMVHQLVIRYYEYLNFNNTYEAIICFGTVMILSTFFYKYYEEPMRKYIRFGIKYKRKLFQYEKESSV